MSDCSYAEKKFIIVTKIYNLQYAGWVFSNQKYIGNTSKDTRWKNLSYNVLSLDATWVVRELSQKLRCETDALAYTVPKGLNTSQSI